MSINKKQYRRELIEKYWNRAIPHELEVIDNGNNLKVTSCTSNMAAWWFSILRAVYPQDHCTANKHLVKLHPEAGVTLKLNREDGTLQIKGKKHLEWFEDNFDKLLEKGKVEQSEMSEMAKIINQHLGFNNGTQVSDLLQYLPACGSIKHGSTYVYQLWRLLLDRWIGRDGDVYVISPLIDANRIADILLLLVKNRLSRSRVHLLTLRECERDSKFEKVYKEAQISTTQLKGPTKKQLISVERLNVAKKRLDNRFGRFFCKIIAVSDGNDSQLLVTSASFHAVHFCGESDDTVAFFRLSADELVNNYLSPLGLAMPRSQPDSPASSTVNGGGKEVETTQQETVDEDGALNLNEGQQSDQELGAIALRLPKADLEATTGNSQSRPTTALNEDTEI